LCAFLCRRQKSCKIFYHDIRGFIFGIYFLSQVRESQEEKLKERGELYSDIFGELKEDSLTIDDSAVVMRSPVVKSVLPSSYHDRKAVAAPMITKISRDLLANAIGESCSSNCLA
jgi:hypothetical protein